MKFSAKTKVCKNCGKKFQIDPDDFEFYNKIQVPEPKFCPLCRLKRRLAFRNERVLYKRTCDLCKKDIISIYSVSSPYKVYCQPCWWSDKWDPSKYGRDFDFSRPFFEQYTSLQKSVPRLALMNKNSINSEYCNHASYNKNCYLAIGGSWYDEDCYYTRGCGYSISCADCESIKKAELCYEIVWGTNLYNCIYCSDSFNCNYCYFSMNLRTCNHCLFCSNLRGKSYHIWNRPVSKEEFNKAIAQISSYTGWTKMLEEFNKFREKTFYPPHHQINCENCVGDYLENCKNVKNGYDVFDGEDCKYLLQCEHVKDMMDCASTGYNSPQVFYEMISTGDRGFNNKFCFSSWGDSDITYCDIVMNSHDCFGCVNMHRKEYCILNKQYPREKYFELRDKIISHMKKTGEYGEFFPISLAPFPYEDSTAQDYFPIAPKKSQPKQAGATPQKYKIPDDIRDVKKDIADEMLVCIECAKNYRIILQELDLYRKLNVPVPRKCFSCRYLRRIHSRNCLESYYKNCKKCGTKIQTTFSPDDAKIVYCEKCYAEALI